MNTNYIRRNIEKYVEMYIYVHIYHTYDVSLYLSSPLIKVGGSTSGYGRSATISSCSSTSPPAGAGGSATRVAALHAGSPNFLLFSSFFKVFHKQTSGGKISESGLLARRHRCWRRANTSRRQRPQRRAPGLEADVEGDMAGSSVSVTLTPSLCFNPSSNLPARAFFLLPLGFFLSPLRTTSLIGILDLENLNLIRRSSRARYHCSLLVFSHRFGMYQSDF